MAETSGKGYPVGNRFACLFELDASGYPKATGTTAYEGLVWDGPKAFSIQHPEPRDIDHNGRDTVVQSTSLPPLTSGKYELRVSDYRFDIVSAITGLAVTSVGEAKEIAHNTSLLGHEPLVGLMCYQMMQDLDTGALNWRCLVFPKVRVTYTPGGMSDNPEDYVFRFKPTKVSKRLWGSAVALATEKYTKAEYFEYHTEGEPRLYTYKMDGVAVALNFPAGVTAYSVDKIATFINGAAAAGDTPALDKVTLAGAGNAADMVCVWMEKA